MKKRSIALATAVALAGGTATAALAAPASADGPERHAHGTIGGATYEIGIEKEHRFEVDADLDGVPAGSTWKLVVRHDGKRIATRVAHAEPDDGRYEVDFREVHSRNTPGADRFKVKIVRVGGSDKVVRTLGFRR